MKRFLLVALAIVLACPNVFAQRNSPVAGNAATLIDLLKKDYNAVDIKLRDEEQLKDRAQVIGIFRSYLEDGYQEFDYTNENDLKSAVTKMKTAYLAFAKAERTYNASNTTTLGTSETQVANAVFANTVAVVDNYEDKRKEYYRDKNAADIEELKALIFYYEAKHQDGKSNELSGNTLIGIIINLFVEKYSAEKNNKADSYAVINNNAALQKNLLSAFVGGGNITKEVDALGKFIAGQVKKTVATFAVQYLKDWLNDNKGKIPVAELLVLLPTTADYIRNFDADKFVSYPDGIKQYIVADLNLLLEHAPGLVNTPSFKNIIAKHPDIELAFEAFKMIPDLEKVKYPGDYFKMLNTSELMFRFRKGTDLQVNIASSINLLEMISNSLTVTENGESRFTNVDFWGNYGGDVRFIQLYLGFLYQQNIKYYDIRFKKTQGEFVLRTTIDELLPTVNVNRVITRFENFKKISSNLGRICTDISKSSEQIYNAAQNIRKLNNANQKIGADTAYTFIKSIIDFSTDLTKNADKLIITFSVNGPPPVSISNETASYLQVATTANEVFKAIHNKNYSAGITQLLDLAVKLVPQNERGKLLIGYETAYKLGQLNYTSWTNWNNAAKLIYDGHFTDSALAKKIAGEIDAIRLFYGQNAKQVDNDALHPLLLEAQRILIAVSVNQPADITKVKNLIHDPKFIQAVVSYYAGAMIIDKTEELIAKNTTVSPEFKDRLISNLKEYVGLIYHTKILHTTEATTNYSTIALDFFNDTKELIATLPQKDGIQHYKQTIAVINFINDMLLAKNTDDVEKAIEHLASTSGTYLDKQKSGFTVGINSYPGLLLAGEFTSGPTLKFAPGVTAPVGLNVTWGNYKGGQSWGIYMPLIDIGAVARVRFNDKDTQTLPELTLKNIFSPGLFVVYGLAKTPFSFSLGTQYGPEVKSISTGVTQSAFRVGAGVTIDIPLFNLYSKPASYKP
jgi:hypothetical protein